MEKIYVKHLVDDEIKYPSEEYFFSPSVFYPEYQYKDIAKTENRVYDLIREGLYHLGYDKDNFGTKEWNPLGDFIKPGYTVLLKPNWVMHENPEERYHDMECLVTHPSFIRAMIDYVVIALKGQGKIILADAPMAQCHFDELMREVHYDSITEFYAKYGIDIIVKDLRGCTFDDNKNKLGVNKVKELNANEEVIVNVGQLSAFNELSKEEINNLKAPKLDPVKMREHHMLGRHEYSLHKDVLGADVIINLPKPKSHRKAGFTACCKNFIGANVRKDLLPHLTYGSIQEHGDAYQNKNIFLKLSNQCNEKYDYYTFQSRNNMAVFFRVLKGFFRRIGMEVGKENFWDGSWYGNDTMWRTISDVDNAVYYADKDGIIQKKHNRVVFSLCDMIISGENEGPLCPTPKRLNTIIMSQSHISCIDKFICRYIGFDDRFVKNIDFLMKQEKINIEDIEIVTDDNSYSYLTYPYTNDTKLIAGYGWHGYIEL